MSKANGKPSPFPVPDASLATGFDYPFSRREVTATTVRETDKVASATNGAVAKKLEDKGE
ncbi:hypothetical protein VT84_14185 [Gemmata sp. SH-PL17]|uniref:hypothetical protein n=1 Tax=Gemmata sp. SH-PL17 TaxID=1630693 RepID=UPI00078B3C25|nr:hypothetical protein [Gemmata sp. SH-PL17]AMV25543.1 hypothetical protein VT84_14185 [Gemmata sp. SH-PL17]